MNIFVFLISIKKRRYNLFSKESFTSKLLPTDRGNFSTENGLVELKKENFQLPSQSWSWKTNDWISEVCRY
jgi:hypothetical protein